MPQLKSRSHRFRRCTNPEYETFPAPRSLDKMKEEDILSSFTHGETEAQSSKQTDPYAALQSC